jgi:hypothetical protein
MLRSRWSKRKLWRFGQDTGQESGWLMSHVPQACPQEPSTLDSTDDLVLTWHGKMIRGGGLI